MGTLSDERCRVLMDPPREVAPLGPRAAGNARRGQRQDPHRYSLRIHKVDCVLWCPGGARPSRRIAAMCGKRLRPEWRHNMLVNIDASVLSSAFASSGKMTPMYLLIEFLPP